jgi:nicotinamide-nucleotide amidase
MLLEEEVVRKLKLGSWMLITIESCTGGLLAHRFTRLAGVSACFAGSFIVYDNALKMSLGVPATLLQSKGAVSPEVALELAEKTRKKLGTSFLPKTLWTLSTTGIAGPTGATQDKPLGLCYLACAHESRKPVCQKVETSQLDRATNLVAFSDRALQFLDEQLQKALDQKFPNP